MAYIGNTPADKFLTLAKQNFTTSATTSYTLDSSVSSTQDIALFINSVRQSPVDAYTVSGTALTLTSATAGTDEMYCVYLGKTVGTVVPASDSITTAMIQSNAVNNAKMADDAIGLAELSATGTASSSTFLRGDNSWASASGDWVKLHGSTLSGTASEVDIDTVFSSSYKVYKLFIVDYDVSTDGLIRVPFLVSGTVQTAADYYIKYNDGYGNFTTSSIDNGVFTDTAGFEINQGWYTNEDNDIKSGMEVTFYNPNDNTCHNSIQFNSILIQYGHWGWTEGVGFYNANIAATGLRVVPSAGTLSIGCAFYLYGLTV